MSHLNSVRVQYIEKSFFNRSLWRQVQDRINFREVSRVVASFHCFIVRGPRLVRNAHFSGKSRDQFRGVAQTHSETPAKVENLPMTLRVHRAWQEASHHVFHVNVVSDLSAVSKDPYSLPSGRIAQELVNNSVASRPFCLVWTIRIGKPKSARSQSMRPGKNLEIFFSGNFVGRVDAAGSERVILIHG